MTRYKVGSIIWGIFAGILLLAFISLLPTKDASAIIPNGIILGITVVGTTINVAEYHKTKKPKTNLQSTVSTLQEPSTVYIQSGNTVSRADGKPISDEEVPYLMELGYRNALEREMSRPKLSARDAELEFQFMQKHGAESQKHCDKFENLNRLAYEETNLDKKILLLQQTIEVFEAVKQWHYSYSKGAKIYFQVFWEQLHNSQNSCFSWVDSVKENLKWQLQKRDRIIPWILENAQIGFLQTAIYKEFPEIDKADLRKIIDELAKQSLIVKSKSGNSYYITKSST